MITPYLHDSRIYLNRIKINTNYFYTSIETIQDNQNMITLESQESDASQLIYADDGGQNGHYELVPLNKINNKGGGEVPVQSLMSFTSIMVFNLTEHKFYIYSQNGIL